MAKYRQLSAEERLKIETLAGEGHSGKSIARILGRSQSTISRRAAGRWPRSGRASWAGRTGSASRSA